jgi:outer membrane lipoprotein-sorting protein
MTLLRSMNLVLASVLLVPALAWAAPPPEPKVEYSADSTMETEGGMTMKSRIYAAPNKQRMEMGGAEGLVVITRRDKKVIWNVTGNMYMEMPMSQSQDPLDMDVQMTTVGEETVNGVKATKSKVIATKKDGSKFGGFFWTTKDGITVKMDLLSKEGNRKDRMTMDLTNLKIGKQDPKLFEVPPGSTKNDMGAMMGGMGGGKGKGKSGAPSMDEMMKGMKDEGGGDVDVNKMMKGLMGR